MSILFGALLLVASPAIAQDRSPSGNSSEDSGGATRTEAPQPENAEEPQICRRILTTGSRTSRYRRVCMTREQWRVHDRNN